MGICPKCRKTFKAAVAYCPHDGSRLAVKAPSGGYRRVRGAPERDEEIGGYRFEEVLGEGGMGVVYRATHVRLGRKVAIKVLRQEWAQNRRAAQRFFAEARAATQVGHENVVEIFDFYENNDLQFFVMELLEGFSLQALTRQCQAIPLSRLWHIASQVADALIAVHDVGIVHRDLKPDNVFLMQSGMRHDFVKLLDFGVAKLNEERHGKSAQVTQQGAIIGTPAYMSPEQIRGESATVRTDVYAFGLMLFRMATGRRAFLGSKNAMWAQRLAGNVPRASEVENLPHPIPKELDDLISDCLAFDEKDRPHTMREVQARLGRALHEEVDLQYLTPMFVPETPATGVIKRPDELEASISALTPQPKSNHFKAIAASFCAGLLCATLGFAFLLLKTPLREELVNNEGDETQSIVIETPQRGVPVEVAGVIKGKTPLTLKANDDLGHVWLLPKGGDPQLVPLPKNVLSKRGSRDKHHIFVPLD